MSVRERLRSERGATIVIATLGMVVLLGFAALALDIGNQFSHRRLAQGAVDASTLAGAIEIASPGGSAQEAVDVILDFVDENLDETVTQAQWVNDCVDPEPLPVTAQDLGLIPATDCISFGVDEIRVTIPELTIDTYFASVVGVDTLSYTASANVEWEFSGGNPPPFAVPVGTTGGDEACLRTNPGPVPMPPQADGSPDPCDDAVFTAGGPFFGTLDPWIYNEVDPGAPNVACTRPGSNVIDFSIANGIDHTTGSFDPDYAAGGGVGPGNPVVLDGVSCPQNAPPSNTFDLQSGLTAQKLRCGLISTRSGACAAGPSFDGVQVTPRLQRATGGPSVTFSDEVMDNRPLWDFLSPGIMSANVPIACQTAATLAVSSPSDYFGIKAEMISCLSNWSSGQDDIFDGAITDSARFAFIPRIDEAGFSSSPVHINDYAPAFIQTLYQVGKETGSPEPGCWETTATGPNPDGWYRHQAGQDFDCGRSNDTVDRVTAIVIPCGALPDTVCIDDSTSSPGGDPVLQFRLSR
jgi:Flp pilus assembly protein TadG